MQAPAAVACTAIIGLFALQGPGHSRHKEWKWMSISAKRKKTNGALDRFSECLTFTQRA